MSHEKPPGPKPGEAQQPLAKVELKKMAKGQASDQTTEVVTAKTERRRTSMLGEKLAREFLTRSHRRDAATLIAFGRLIDTACEEYATTPEQFEDLRRRGIPSAFLERVTTAAQDKQTTPGELYGYILDLLALEYPPET